MCVIVYFFFFFLFQTQSFLFWCVRYRLTSSGSICVGQVIALDHASIKLEANKERNPKIMYTDSERAEKCSRQAQDSLFLTFFHALSCYAIFHITCHTRWTQPQPLGGHQFCGERMLANVDMFDCENEQWVGNKCGQFDCKNEQWVGNKCGQFDCGNEQWVGDKCFACILIFLRCVYQLYLRTNIYIYPSVIQLTQ